MADGQEQEKTDDGSGIRGEGRSGESVEAFSESARGDSEKSGAEEMGGYIYFVETEDGKYIKIGYSAQLVTRMSRLETLRPAVFKLRVLGYMPGSKATEKWLHNKFAGDRDNGEWFRDSSALRDFVQSLGLIQVTIKTPRLNTKLPKKNPAAVILDDISPPEKQIATKQFLTKIRRRTIPVLPAPFEQQEPQESPTLPKDKNPHAVALRKLAGSKPGKARAANLTVEQLSAIGWLGGKVGGKIGGRVRAARMTPEQRSESARKAALARWNYGKPEAHH
jgi:hypothetical protein